MTSRQIIDAFAFAPAALHSALRAASAPDPRRQLVATMVEEAQIRRLALAQRRRAAASPTPAC